ncbi:DNA polymerase III subunit delta' [Flavobacteriaceae bacterium]|nr:DNA polymerase III subunit delta' [Flavobacteriaceae bacterium]
MSQINLVGQKKLIHDLEKKINSGRLAHSYLLFGPSGSGKLSVAIKFAELILCSKHKDRELEVIGAQQKINSLNHPDLHFVYPVNTSSKVKSKATSKHFVNEWRESVIENPYMTLSKWLEKIEIANKKGNISVNEAEEINKIMSLKSYEGGYKVMVIWMAENMNTECANKLLKLIEEPSPETVFLLLTENQSAILPTIKSRCQKINIPPIDTKDIAESLIKKDLADSDSAHNTANMSGGDYSLALNLLNSDVSAVNFESIFIEWVRLAFKVKTTKSAVAELVNWSEKISKLPKDVQKQFFVFSLGIFRKSMLKNYKSGGYESLFKDKSFKFERFTPFIHNNNIIELYEEINKAIYELNRNGNPKIIITDLSLKLTRLIHQKPSAIDG